MTDDTSSQVYRGALGEKAHDERDHRRDAGRRPAQRIGAIANTLFHSTGGGATENNENVYVSSTGAKVAGAVSYLRGSMRSRAGRQRLRRGVPVRDLGDQDLHRRAAVGLVRRRRRTNVGTLTALDLRDRGVSGRLISVTLIGSRRHEEGLGRRLPVGLQRRAPGGRPDDAQHARSATAPIP